MNLGNCWEKRFNMNIKELQVRPVISLFDGGDDAAAAAAAADAAAALATADKKAQAEAAAAAAAADDPNTPISGDPDARFTQDQLNKVVQDRLAKQAKRQAVENSKMEAKLQEVLATQSLSEEEKVSLQNAIDNLQKQNRTKEEQAKHEKKLLSEQYENQLKEAMIRGDYWEKEYRSATVNRALADAATKQDAFMPSQVVTILKEYTKLVKPVDADKKPVEGAALQPMVELPGDVDADGKPIETQRTPEEAVTRLKELQPNLFKANVVSGVGGNSSTGGVAPGQGGEVDVSQLTTEQFMELYKKDPKLVGRKRRKF
jgi:hypothetical protein